MCDKKLLIDNIAILSDWLKGRKVPVLGGSFTTLQETDLDLDLETPDGLILLDYGFTFLQQEYGCCSVAISKKVLKSLNKVDKSLFRLYVNEDDIRRYFLRFDIANVNEEYLEGL